MCTEVSRVQRDTEQGVRSFHPGAGHGVSAKAFAAPVSLALAQV